jgi:hypothetical protein
MPRRARLALTAGLLVAGCLCGRAAPLPPVPVLSRIVWTGGHDWFGGFSGLVVTPGGTRFIAVNDRGWITDGRFTRDARGAITGITAAPLHRLRGKAGKPLAMYLSDAEDLAQGPDGHLYVAFEGWTRVSRYPYPRGRAWHLPRPNSLSAIPENRAFESVAVAPGGTLWAIAEDAAGGADFPLWRYAAGVWDRPHALPRRGTFLPVSADFGPDGRLYVLERDALVPVGFATRLRRFDWGAGGPTGETVLAETGLGAWDNMEALSVWRGPHGLVATLLSDDNFLPVQRTEFIEIALPD